MVTQLLSPSQPKNLSDLIVLVVLAVHISGLYLLPASIKIPTFAIVYLFWRACYNAGIGWLLHEQSNYNRMVNWAKKSKVFEDPAKGINMHPLIYKLLKTEMETKIPNDYKFEEAPVEYNAWLTFRRVVDLILMCDFVSYCLFAIACGALPVGEHPTMTVARWTAGIGLVLFNLWVKLDAHRVVKDYAWYWGDFFFLIDQELTFDGVFEMAPHPMYSVGYAGYYGISLMAASYKVLFISVVAHAAQFAFLALVENPHIDKTYNPPPPRKRSVDRSTVETESDNVNEVDNAMKNNSTALLPPNVPYVRDLVGLQNMDLHRGVDVSVILLSFYLYTMALITPNTALYQVFFVANAVAWRLWYTLGVGYVLDRQSNQMKWTRHFIKYGETSEEAWRQWRNILHISMVMCYASFIAAAWKMYTLPPDWQYGLAALRHVVGTGLIALQIWTAFSIYESLGEFGWFFGDFFFEQGSKLTYSGIYRFLNNPERVLGLAGIWGFALITWSKSIFFIALLSHILQLAFLQFVERPHMQKRYGMSLRTYSGLSSSFKKSLPQPLREWHGNVDRVLDETAEFVEDFIESARPKLAAGVETIVKDTKALFRNYPARVSITRLAPDLAGFDPKDYTIEIEGTHVTGHPTSDKVSGREGDMARTLDPQGKQCQPLMLEYGAPISVKWTAPMHHSKKDWVGLYMIADNSSRDVSRVASSGRWTATNKNVYDSVRPEQGILVSDKQAANAAGAPAMSGEMQFHGDKLWWTTGVFEFRYHHDGKHNVMAISKPFEIRISKFDEDDTELDVDGTLRTAIEQTLLPMVRDCFDRDPEIAPNKVDEAFGTLVERDGKFARRVVFAVWHM